MLLSTTMVSALLFVVLVASTPSASGLEKRVCAKRIVKLVKLLCEGCIDYWGKDGRPAGPEGYFEEENSAEYENRFDSLLKEHESLARLASPAAPGSISPGALERPGNLDELVLACCLHRTCTYSTMTSYCCGKKK